MKNTLRFLGSYREWLELQDYVLQAVIHYRGEPDDVCQVLGFTLARLYGRLQTRLMISPVGQDLRITLKPEEVHAVAHALQSVQDYGHLINQLWARADQLRLAIPARSL